MRLISQIKAILLAGTIILSGISTHCALMDTDCRPTDGSCNEAIAAGILAAFFPPAEAPPPALPVSGAQLWFPAGFGRTLSGNTVIAWADQSGNGFHASAPGNSGAQLNSNAVNGQPALTFDGVTSNFTLGAGYPFITASDGGLTIFAVARSDHTDGSNLHHLVDFGFFASDGYGLRYSSNSGGTTEGGMWTPTASGGVNIAFDVTATTADYVILAFRVELGVEMRMYVNGASVANSGISVVEMTATTVREAPFRSGPGGGPYSIGMQSKFAESDRTFKGDLAEIIQFKSALSTTDRELIQCYLSTKYGITVTHGC